ncbi:MAG: amidase [Uliginosibacterium sp.]|nr:amidase [Uliginosibacterium sp.]
MKLIKPKLPSLQRTAAVVPLNSSGATLSGPDRGIPRPDSSAPTAEERAILALSATELARRIAAQELSSVQVVRAFVGQITRHNVTYNAIVQLDLDAALERQGRRRGLARGEVWGPLHGVPVTVKDTYATRGLRTTAGDPALVNHIPQEDAVAVALLRRSGAIVLAKTNAATLAMDMQTTNALFGTTNNPWNVNMTVGGSSGGCAAAVATHMSPLSFGSDLAGSIRLPAAYVGIWGLRPTHGVISFRGHIPPKPGEVDGIRSMAVLGPLANRVEDLELALSVLAQRSPEDATVTPLRERAPAPASVAGLRLAYMDELGGVPVSREVKMPCYAWSRRSAPRARPSRKLSRRTFLINAPGRPGVSSWPCKGATSAPISSVAWGACLRRVLSRTFPISARSSTPFLWKVTCGR